MNITASAIWSALVAHCVGTQTTGMQSFSPTAFAVSTDLPPPQPIMTSMSRSSAFAATSSIFLLVHSVTLSSKPTRGTPAVSRLAWTLALTLANPVLPPTAKGLDPYCFTYTPSWLSTPAPWTYFDGRIIFLAPLSGNSSTSKNDGLSVPRTHDLRQFQACGPRGAAKGD